MELNRASRVAMAVLILPRLALADNCGSMWDCFSSAEAAALAAAALTLIVGLAIDFSPLGRARGIFEAVTGVDVLTGEKLSLLSRLLGILPGGKTAREVDHAADAARNLAKTERQLEKMLAKAPGAKKEIDALAEGIARQVGGKVATAPIKGEARALEKAVKDYGGDASKLKDLARNTVVVPANKFDDAVKELEKSGAKVKRIEPQSNPLGYSGANTNVNTKAGIPGEIQVNTPEMIFAKEKPEVAKSILGEEVYNDIAKKTGVPGGRGHEMYEEWRSLPPGDPRRTEIEVESRAYHDHIRKTGGSDGD